MAQCETQNRHEGENRTVYFQKVDGTIREAYGTLNARLVPVIAGIDNRRKNDTTQVYFDTERQEWRCFKKANLIY
jgi:hypothetical protein